MTELNVKRLWMWTAWLLIFEPYLRNYCAVWRIIRNSCSTWSNASSNIEPRKRESVASCSVALECQSPWGNPRSRFSPNYPSTLRSLNKKKQEASEISSGSRIPKKKQDSVKLEVDAAFILISEIQVYRIYFALTEGEWVCTNNLITRYTTAYHGHRHRKVEKANSDFFTL